MGHYEEVRNILQSYINDNPNDYDTKLRYYYAQSLIWLSDYDSALPIIRILTEEYPEVIKYRLLYAQALAWSDKDINESEINVSYILERDPQNLNALLLKISLNISKQEFDTAQNIINSVKLINPYNKDVDILQSNLDSERMFFIKNQLYESGKKLFLEGKCSEALPYYKEIVLMDSSDTLIYKEYGDVNYCSENYEKALSIYEDLLDNDFKYNIAMDRANLLLKMGDTLKAVDAYKNIIINKPYDFHSNLYVADLYSLTEQYDSANAVYDKLLLSDLQPDQLQIVKQRKKWVPAQGFASALASFPSYVGVAPIGTIYVDNISFRLNKVGSKLDLGISNFLTVGVSYYKTKLRGNDLQKNLSTYKGHGQFKIGKYFSFAAEYGVLRSSRETHDKIIITSIRINKENVYSVGGTYTQTDAAVILYSPYLIDKSMRADSYKFDGNYKHKSGVQFSGYFQYLDIKENDITRGNNYGNQFQFRLGKLFHKTIIAGYELYYIDYKYESNLYYSPNDFESHSIWLDWTIEKDKYHDIRLGGKFGYISQSDVTIREIYGDAFYFVADQLKISMKVAFGSSFRFDSSYNYFSWILSAYLSLD
jgi:tetratricopeptide (TPR) repeat protein